MLGRWSLGIAKSILLRRKICLVSLSCQGVPDQDAAQIAVPANPESLCPAAPTPTRGGCRSHEGHCIERDQRLFFILRRRKLRHDVLPPNGNILDAAANSEAHEHRNLQQHKQKIYENRC